MNTYKKWFSMILCVILLLSLLPVQASRANPEPEKFATEELAVSVMAYDIEKKKDVPVEGAVVTLQKEDTVLRDGVSDENGIAVLSLAGLTDEDLQNAEVHAYKTVDKGKAINGDRRDPVFQYLRTDGDNDYYRYEYQLHSEEIDANGTWRGQALPFSTSKRADIVFVVDATGSMDEYMDHVKQSVTQFMAKLNQLEFHFRYSIIEYRDERCGEMPILHNWGRTHWADIYAPIADVLQGIEADGGGDTDESLGDVMHYYVLDPAVMDYRNDAYKFVFIVTDADSHFEIRGGSSLEFSDINRDLKDMNLAASVITIPELQENYELLYKNTGGTCFDLESDSLSEELYSYTAGRIQAKTAEMELTLSEPRLLVNLSVCYLANDETSRSKSYLSSMKHMLDLYSQTMAQSTDGHVYVDKVLLFSTDSIMDFYDLNELASMADIQIQTKENEGGLTIHSNAYLGGFFYDSTISNEESLNKFSSEEAVKDLQGRKNYYRIQMSGTEGAGWNNSFIEAPGLYCATLMHESGHYIFYFYDEYLDQDYVNWRDRPENDKPYPLFGLMDEPHEDIEISKRNIDYHYQDYHFSEDHPIATYQYIRFWASCEEALADLLEKGIIYYHFNDPQSANTPYPDSFFVSPYRAVYSMVSYQFSPADRLAAYPYAALTEDDFILLGEVNGTGTGTGSGSENASEGGTGADPFGDAGDAEIQVTPDAIGYIEYHSGEETFTVKVEEEPDAAYAVYLQKLGERGFTPVELIREDGNHFTAELPVEAGDLAEVRITKLLDGLLYYNTWFIDRSEACGGYQYTSPDGKVMAYGTSEEDAIFTFIADNTFYTYGDYFSLNQATHIYTNGVPMTGGEIYSVASCTEDLDFSSVSWFKYDGASWTMLPTDLDLDENHNIEARADLLGEGMYVLMGKRAAAEEVMPPMFLMYEPSKTVDAVVTLSFEDFNENSKFYYVYYSEDLDADPDFDELPMQVYEAAACEHTSDTERALVLNLREREKLFNVFVEIVLADGSRSGLASVLVKTDAADRDGDGIPDWYLDKYGLWLDDPEKIAGNDPDGDGRTTLREYLDGTNPIVPDEPEEIRPTPGDTNKALDNAR